MPLTEERKKLISDITTGNWVYDLPKSEPEREEQFKKISKIMEKKLKEFLKNANCSEELHEFVLHYNWSDGVEAMIDIVRKSSCDKNTALLVFWKSNPADYQDYSERSEIPSWDNDRYNIWDMIHYIMERASKGAYGSSDMPLDYREFVYRLQKPLWEIPGCMFGEEESCAIKLNDYDAGFGNYGPHCYSCNKKVESLDIKECPHCSKSFVCDCDFCKKKRGELLV